MLKRLYIDNYKSLVNFELKPDYLCLLLGDNGSGKSSLFQVVSNLRAILVEKMTIAEAFPASTLTRWQTQPRQIFDMEVEISDAGAYHYHLEIAHLKEKQPHVALESLEHNGNRLFSFEEGKINLYGDNYRVGAEFYWNYEETGLGKVVARPNNTKLIRFLEWMQDVTCVTVDPTRMEKDAATEAIRPSPRLENIANWLRHLLQERMDDMEGLRDQLSNVIGMKSFSLRRDENGIRKLNVSIKTGANDEITLGFDELSDGQRVLVGLYSLLRYCVKPDSLLFIDEPDNFVTLSELQPWLSELSDSCEDQSSQAVLISHSAEVINYLASSYGTVLRRYNNGPTTAQPFRLEDDFPYTPAQAFAMREVG